MSAPGTKRTYRDVWLFVRFRGEADIDDRLASISSVSDETQAEIGAACAVPRGGNGRRIVRGCDVRERDIGGAYPRQMQIDVKHRQRRPARAKAQALEQIRHR